MIPALLLLVACTVPDADSYLAWQVRDGAYTVAPRAKGTLRDPATLDGERVQAWAGGALVYLEDGDCAFEGGHPLYIAYDVVDGVAVPFDEDGLVLWSLYGHLEDLSDVLDRFGLTFLGLLPVTATHTPVLPDLLLEMMPLENAAYATGCNVLILLEDMIRKDLPLAANAGVIRHEFGHGIFHVFTTGDPQAPGPFEPGELTASSLYYTSLSEGLADMTASLTLDDPDFIEASLAMPERDVSGAWTAVDVELPEAFIEAEGDSLLPLYDPYPLGTVFAATAWDLREITGDADMTYRIVLEALERWSAAGDMGNAFSFLDFLVDVSGVPEALCPAVQMRFGGTYEVAACAD